MVASVSEFCLINALHFGDPATRWPATAVDWNPTFHSEFTGKLLTPVPRATVQFVGVSTKISVSPTERLLADAHGTQVQLKLGAQRLCSQHVICNYSSRKACTGSIRITRAAGAEVASNVASKSTASVSRSVFKSRF